ncbi:hypothetical protein MVES_000896 [Malassezia vespertilionis]|uniref:Transmembrane protein n=2 Tax=Malassezia vespertilionis TaxID=2020962 RepID=A0A2N1JFB3_9BASI|nr:hypothetical protein MVES_000896 [Malassezia vespertilionis]
MQLRQSIIRRMSFYGASRLSVTALATATMLTGAAVLIYYAPWGDFDLDMGQILPYPLDFESFSMEQTGEDDCDDDEHIDPELLDGFGFKSGRSFSAVLTSSDPTSGLCHKPITVSLDGSPRRASTPNGALGAISSLPATPLRASVSQSPGSSTPVHSILRRDSHQDGLPTIYLRSDSVSNENMFGLSPLRSPRCSLSPTYSLLTKRSCDESLWCPSMSLDGDGSTSRSSNSTSRSIMPVEPDWAPFANTHERARKRAVVASFANSVSDQQVAMRHCLPHVSPPELEDGREFWFERFTQSTAAAGRNWDWRRRCKKDLADILDDEIAKDTSLKQVTDGEKEPVASYRVPFATIDLFKARSNLPNDSLAPMSPTSSTSFALPPTPTSPGFGPNLTVPEYDLPHSESAPELSVHGSSKRKITLDMDTLERSTSSNDAGSENVRPKSPRSPSFYNRAGVEPLQMPYGKASTLQMRFKNKFAGRVRSTLRGM